MPIVNLKTNHLEKPLGFNLGSAPILSWVVVDSGSTYQAKAQIQVSNTSTFENVIFDSGMKENINSRAYKLKIELKPRTRYYWKVFVLTDAETVIGSEATWFETGKLNEPWSASWITPQMPLDAPPILQAEFDVKQEVKSARLYICGLGLYELYCNNQRVGNEYLAPGLCAYDKWIAYQTYDVTPYLKEEKAFLEIHLGDGWYKGRFSFLPEFRYGTEYAAIAELHITYCDDTTRIFETHPKYWKTRRSKIEKTSIFDGETRNDTLQCNKLYPVEISEPPCASLEERRSPGAKIMHTIKPIAIINTPAGETVLDMGQNMTGWLSFECKANYGDEIYLQFGEVLQQGNFYRENLRGAKAEYMYISDGVQKTVQPSFTFYGFRYVKLTKWSGPCSLDMFKGLCVYSNMEQTGHIETDNEKVNKLISNSLWGQRDNYLDVPTDCPQRDERMGWTGDAQIFFGTAAFNMDVYAFFNKYCYDLWKEQQVVGGAFPAVIPGAGIERLASCAWGDAATIIPWNMYVRYGDIQILENQYQSMCAWVDYIKGRTKLKGNSHLWRGDFQYGDWLALDVENSSENPFGGTDATFLATCFYFYSSKLVAKAAKLLGYEEDCYFYENLAEEINKDILLEYVSPNGNLCVQTQTAFVIALQFEILPQKWQKKAAKSLRRLLQKADCHLNTGFVGTPFLCRVLSNTQSNDIAYELLLNEDYPSWLYEVNLGATTVWERWNSILPDGTINKTGMNSLNHYAYGSIVEWIYRDVAGINPDENEAGFKQFSLCPKPQQGLNSVKAEFNSPMGTIKSSWQRKNGNIYFNFTVPHGSKADLRLPSNNGEDILPKILSAGEYEFVITDASNAESILTLDTPLHKILCNEEIKEKLVKKYDILADFPMSKNLYKWMSMREILEDGYIEESEDDIAAFLKELILN